MGSGIARGLMRWSVLALSALVLVAGCARNHEGHILVGAESECVTCHRSDYETTTSPRHLDDPTFFTTNCAQCHSTSAWRPALGGQADVADPARTLVIDAGLPVFSGTSIATITTVQETLTSPMLHRSTAIDPVAAAACTNCHSGVGSLYPGSFHASLLSLSLPQPSTCNDCHAATTLPTGFVGPDATMPVRVPASAEMRHEAVLWMAGAATATPVVPAGTDCSVCHAAPSDTASSWAGARFHGSLGATPPVSCLDCHANSRPDHVLDATNSSLTGARHFDHALGGGLGDCNTCHTDTSSWAGGTFHHAGDAAPTECTTCHEAERPTTASGWTSATYTSAPFDYGTNPNGITHGAGQDCALCHGAPGTTGGTGTWAGGRFVHGVASGVDASTCVACHATQRPDLVLGGAAAAAAVLPGNFDHVLNGTGDCFGCHQASVMAGRYASYFAAGGTLPGGDWMGGTEYPGAFVSSTSAHVTVTETALHRTGALVTSMTTAATAYYNGMLHTSTQIPPEVAPGDAMGTPNYASCWHCHTSTGTTVTSYVDGRFHSALAGYTAMAGGAVTPLAEPMLCNDCHAQMRPHDIVERSASVLVPMDHAAAFASPATIAGRTVSGVAELDCSTCHAMPGASWADGVFHARIGAAQPADCTTCHYPAMADAAHADLTSGTTYAMRHRSVQITRQSCAGCHTSSLARASTADWTSWSGATLHPHVPSAPTACVDCHGVSSPTGVTTAASGQHMSHRATAAVGRDCVACHATDASSTPLAWSRSTGMHAHVASPATCQECHGPANGGGAGNHDAPTALVASAMITSASAATGVAGMHDEIDHTDVNVSGRDCNFCHAVPAGAVTDWSGASLHSHFGGSAALIANGSTGRCSHCHAGLTPTAGFTLFAHGTIGSSDCATCHSFPGTGTPAMANWLGAVGGAPAMLSVGGFTIPAPPAATPTMQSGASGIAHPTTGATACATCHGASGGGRMAIGYDHSPVGPITNHCNTCHEAGSDLVAPVWDGTARTGDTRPFTLASVRATFSGNTATETYPNHFYPVDCDECHSAPVGVATGTSGTAFTTAWRFVHDCRVMTPVTTCRMCHTRTTCG